MPRGIWNGPKMRFRKFYGDDELLLQKSWLALFLAYHWPFYHCKSRTRHKQDLNLWKEERKNMCISGNHYTMAPCNNVWTFLHVFTVALKLKIIFLNNFFKIFFGKKGSEMSPIFQIPSKITAWTFSDFFHEITIAQRLKIDSNYFFGKKSCTGVCRQKVAQNELFEL